MKWSRMIARSIPRSLSASGVSAISPSSSRRVTASTNTSGSPTRTTCGRIIPTPATTRTAAARCRFSATARWWISSKSDSRRAARAGHREEDPGPVHLRQRGQHRVFQQAAAGHERDHPGGRHARADRRMVARRHPGRQHLRRDRHRHGPAAGLCNARRRRGPNRPRDRREGHQPAAARPGPCQVAHDAFFYYSRNNLCAVRCGPWKLHTDGQLYNLDKDIGETTDLAGQKPEIVARLNGLLDRCRADLDDPKSCRPVGKCANPRHHVPANDDRINVP